MSDDLDVNDESHGPVRYWWFEGDSVSELRRQLNAIESPRLEVHPDGRKILLYVTVATGAGASTVAGPINESHPCPPWCN